MDSVTSRERYQRLNEHFLACADSPEGECRDYVAKVLQSDPDLGQELEKLLRHHRSDPQPVPPKPVETAVVRRRKKRPSFAAVVLAAGAIVFVAVLGIQYWTLTGLERHLKSEMGRGLRSGLDYRVARMRAWASRQQELARAVLEEPALVADIAVLVELAKQPDGLKERLLKSDATRKVTERMLRVPPEIGNRGFGVISPSGTALCAESEAIIGIQVAPSGGSMVRRANLGEWFLSKPYPDRLHAMGMTPKFEHPVMTVSGPVRDSAGTVIAMGVFRFSPDRFYEFLAPTMAEYVAFDDKSLLLNHVGDVEGLKRLGVFPDVPGSSPVFRAHLRDPGVRLESGARPDSPPDSWPPTLMSRSASQGSSGVDDTGHRDFRGRPVLAAWTWLPEWEMGVGNQIPVDRVLAPTRFLRGVFQLTLVAVVVGTLGLLGLSRYVRVGLLPSGSPRYGSYVVERRIGKGGMAEIFKARHSYLKRPGAVKVLTAARPDPSSIERFEREARLTSRLGHPNTIQILDYGESADGKLYYVMEYVEGLTLAQLLSLEGRLPVARVVYLLKQIAGSLEEAHELGLYHRDLKPSNVMICCRGAQADLIKVLDFGIACSVAGPAEDVTMSIGPMGTPAFIAPERIREPQKMDPRSDIYSFGAVAFHLLTGRNVFEGSGPTELIYQVMSAERPSPSQIRGGPVPQELEDLVRDCLSVDVQRRPGSFREIDAILQSLTGSGAWQQEQARRWWALNRDKVAGFVDLTS